MSEIHDQAEIFDTKYPPDISHQSSEMDNDGQVGMFETYGDDIKHVLSVNNNSPKRVWTCIDGDDGTYMIAGYHLVNRIYYYISSVEWKSDDEEYQIEVFEDEEEY